MSTRSHDAPTDVLQRLARVDTTSLVDAAAGAVRVLPAAIRPVRRGLRMVGRALTADTGEDLMSVLGALRQAGPGDVLVVSAGGEHAVLGELFATESLRRGVTGVVIDGLCRDSRTLAELDLPVYARGVAPSAYPARGVPNVGVPIAIDGVEVRPGDVVLGDDDGVVVAGEEEVLAVLDAAEAIQRREEALRAAITSGASLFDSLNYDEHVAAVRDGGASKLEFL
ncbi:MAG: 4-hydroxy-4-methyl-2-oxoglutarate aldolase [Solirubrobacteraceae bacterium]|nr:4-hydroxy-4-methyl-2-oxoglutarate aldolase [Solirubrobacteraceae bacterium]